MYIMQLYSHNIIQVAIVPWLNVKEVSTAMAKVYVTHHWFHPDVQIAKMDGWLIILILCLQSIDQITIIIALLVYI